MKHLLTILLSLFILLTTGSAQIPPGYYDPAAGLNGTALRAALHDIIDGHTQVSYDDLYTYFEQTDKKTDNTVWDMYSDIPEGTPPYTYQFITADLCGNYTQEGDCFNREHSWPKSWFGGEVYPMYSDLFQLYPTDGFVNNKRGNYPYGPVGSTSWTSANGSKVGSCSWPGYSGTVFEPRDEYKGDFARTYFYMEVRYWSEDSGWPGSDMTSGSQLLPWAQSMMLAWDAADPVSAKETGRNNAVYQVQHNRNPFIDHPEYAQLIWGPASVQSPVSEQFFLSIYPNPVSGQALVRHPLQEMSSQILLTDELGQVVLKVPVAENQSETTLDMTSFSPGIYFLTLTGNGFCVCRKVVVVK